MCLGLPWPSLFVTSNSTHRPCATRASTVCWFKRNGNGIWPVRSVATENQVKKYAIPSECRFFESKSEWKNNQTNKQASKQHAYAIHRTLYNANINNSIYIRCQPKTDLRSESKIVVVVVWRSIDFCFFSRLRCFVVLMFFDRSSLVSPISFVIVFIKSRCRFNDAVDAIAMARPPSLHEKCIRLKLQRRILDLHTNRPSHSKNDRMKSPFPRLSPCIVGFADFSVSYCRPLLSIRKHCKFKQVFEFGLRSPKIDPLGDFNDRQPPAHA